MPAQFAADAATGDGDAKCARSAISCGTNEAFFVGECLGAPAAGRCRIVSGRKEINASAMRTSNARPYADVYLLRGR